MTEKQFGTQYGPPLQRGDKITCIANLQAEIDRRAGVPYGFPLDSKPDFGESRFCENTIFPGFDRHHGPPLAGFAVSGS